MIRQTEEPPRETIPEPVLADYRLDYSPRRREGGSLLFGATAADGSPAALQVSADPVTSRRTRARFRRLARARAELRHPALLDVREIGQEDGRVFAATDPFPVRSLADLLREGPPEPALALRMLKAIADGLDAAHGAGVIHRTLSPESVLLDGERVRLDLFGIFTVVGQASWGDVVRREPHLHYESPEGVRCDELVPASNVYSLTGLLVHALTGEEPFVHHDPVMITYAHLSHAPPKPSERKPELPGGLDAIVAQGMAKHPAKRPESAGALIAAAAMVLRTSSTPSPKPIPAPAPAPAAADKPVAETPVAEKPVAQKPAAPPPRPVAGPSSLATAPPPRMPAVAAEPAGRSRAPVGAWLAPLGPVLLVLVVAALFGALLGMPGGARQQAASTVPTADQPAVQRLDSVRFRLRDELAFAATADEQADAAQQLAVAYGRAADHMTSSALVSPAHGASVAYLAMESAARAGDEDSYDDARAHAEAAEKQIESDLARLNGSRAPG
jgi:serine/threonine-protein kinase